jgi:hypothetical protein
MGSENSTKRAREVMRPHLTVTGLGIDIENLDAVDIPFLLVDEWLKVQILDDIRDPRAQAPPIKR